jgi:hypothetical protein
MYNELSYPHLADGCGMDAISMQRKILMKRILKPLFRIFKVKLQFFLVENNLDIKVVP